MSPTITLLDLSQETTRLTDGTYRITKDKSVLAPVTKTEGYFVAIKGAEVVLQEDAEANRLNALQYIDAFLEDLDNGHLFGVWTDFLRHRTYLDLTLWIKDRDRAIEFGRKNEQIAIWDCANNVAIVL